MKKSVKAYHGTSHRFHQFEQSKARVINDYYGGGVAYFTDDLEIGKSYAKNVAKRNNSQFKFVYEVQLNFSNLFDVDEKYTGDDLLRMVGRDVETFARGAGLLRLGADRATVIGNLREGSTKLTGDQVFKGLSNGMINTSKARSMLIKAGYDGLRHNGGRQSLGKFHNVYLSYNVNNIKILRRYILNDRPAERTDPAEVYTFIN